MVKDTMLQVGDIVKFFDYDYAAFHRDTSGECWRGHSQPLVMPNEKNIGTWVEVISARR